MARYYALAERPFIEADGESYWGLPNGTIGSVDLAPVGAHSHVFVTSDKPFNPEDVAVQIGDGTRLEDYKPDASERSAWTALLGVSWTPGWSLLDALWAVLTVDSDPDGELRAKPIMPTHKGVLELHLGGHSLIRAVRMPKDPRQAPHWSAMQRVLQRDYEALRRGNPRLAQKYLGAQQRKYRMTPEAARDAIGNGRDLPERPDSQANDDFNRANENLHGSEATVSGVGQGWTWNVVTGSITVTGNEAVSGTSVNSWAVADFALSSADMYAQGEIGADNTGTLVRGTTSAVTGYCGRLSSGFNFALFRVTSGSFVNIGGGSSTASSGTVITTADGSSISSEIEGDETIGPVTDTNHTTGVRGGLRFFGVGTTADNFEAADLLPGGTFNPAWARNSNVIIQAGR